jgi:aminoglycoside phosphotransferase (APT) family kinase protein
MEIPPELLRPPPRATLDWIASVVGPRARVTDVRRLRNAWAAAVHAVDVDDRHGVRHELVVRRWARTDIPPDPGVVENEAAALSLLGSGPGLRVPTLVATDPTGARADVPALVMTRLPGTDVLAPPDMEAFLDGLVAALHTVHATPVPAVGLGDYAPWGLDGLGEPPAWSRVPRVWRRAFDIARRPPPSYVRVVCHRDFHPGNVLWENGEVTGVVDWTSACVGPAAVDVAHCRMNLTMLFGIDVADDFARRYGPVTDLAWFDLVDVVGWGPLDAWRWHDAGRDDITDESLARASDDFVAAAVARLS